MSVAAAILQKTFLLFVISNKNRIYSFWIGARSLCAHFVRPFSLFPSRFFFLFGFYVQFYFQWICTRAIALLLFSSAMLLVKCIFLSLTLVWFGFFYWPDLFVPHQTFVYRVSLKLFSSLLFHFFLTLFPPFPHLRPPRSNNPRC